MPDPFNIIGEWAFAMVIIIGALVLGKILYYFFKKVMKSLASKTKTKLDDIIVDMIEEPIVFGLTVFGIWYGLKTLTFPERFQTLLGNGIQFLVV